VVAAGHLPLLRATLIGTPVVTIDGQPVAVGHELLVLTLPFNLAGMPAVSVPLPRPGPPIGIQVIGVNVDEHDVLRVAAGLPLQP
jgi:aspartyl-tRNA(Asn)/glutamyl-tRNA(Gln) amidotransferase subunit A